EDEAGLEPQIERGVRAKVPQRDVLDDQTLAARASMVDWKVGCRSGTATGKPAACVVIRRRSNFRSTI
ncbi:MAG: hypothetical protein M3M94_01945, partial [Actinomycetota bacterium]|nr:hypothetical protein [Actinomycetota bacterium]